MKKSISYLPKDKREDLNYIVNLILKRLPQAEMIILYGSYARDEYQIFRKKEEYGIVTTYISDYDILVVTHGITDRMAGKILDNVDDIYYQNTERQTPIQFINESIEKLNQDLSEGRYFYTDVKREGVLLYDSGRFKLKRRRKLRYDEIRDQAEDYFKQKSARANEFLMDAYNSFHRGSYVQSSFYLHQACENYYYSIRLLNTLKNNKQHNLAKLWSAVKKYSDDLIKVFPRNTVEEKRYFDLLKAAYVEARYNPDFLVTKQDIVVLIKRVEELRDVAEMICKKKLKEYASKIPQPTDTPQTYIRNYETTDNNTMIAADDAVKYKKKKKEK